MRDGPFGERPAPSRRDFLRYLGIGGAGLVVAPLLGACQSDPIDPSASAAINLGDDSGALNFAWALQQLQYQYYYTIFGVYQGYTGATALEFTTIQRLWTHHSGVQALFRRSTPDPVTGDMQFDFSDIDFTSRSAVLTYAIELEDIATAGMHGLLPYAPDDATLTLLAKIASVEARHSATLRDLVDVGAGKAATTSRTSFAGDDVVVPTTGANELLTPRQVYDLIRPRFRTNLTLREG